MSATVIRFTTSDDDQRLARLAALDSQAALRGPALAAEVDGELRAAIDLAGRVIADPFRPTAELVGLLQYRARQLAA
ncbi:MAG: hypothetical protein HZB46_18160 [Solirubrobacterales bacterium]|nr:hypothetical protein [Solirubrobacterales bacterium]